MNKTAGKLLLVSSAPPGGAGVGEIILRDLCALLPEGMVTTCIVNSRSHRPSITKPDRWLEAPSEVRPRPLPGRCGNLLHAIDVRSRFAGAARRIAVDVAAEARLCGATKVWITLDTPTLIVVAGYLADMLTVPLLTLVWDPPDYLALGRKWDRLSRRWLLRRFGRALRASRGVAVVSESMAEDYARQYSARCTVLQHALHPVAAAKPPPDDIIRIGFAGTLYDSGQMDVLCEALNRCRWTVAGRPVFLRVMGNWLRFRSLTAPSRIELLGRRDTVDETRELLGECHLLYLPQSFDVDLRDFSRLSFPSKLSTYVATGRPVLVHAPEYASAACFCAKRKFGIVCGKMDPEELQKCLCEMIEPVTYARLCEGVQSAYARELNPEVMRKQFALFMGAIEGGQ